MQISENLFLVGYYIIKQITDQTALAVPRVEDDGQLVDLDKLFYIYRYAI